MARRDLWPRVEPLLSRVERPARYLNHEWGCAAPVAEGDFAFCMIYPDTYELGQANQAVRILVNAVNAMGGMGAERAFLPAVDMADLMREEGVPLFSLESCRPVVDFDVVGITLPHELAATNVLETLDLAGIPLRTADRAEGDPIVLAGGPCAYNPAPTRRSSTSSWWGRAKSSCPRCWRSSASCARPARPGPISCARWRGAWGAPTCRACTAGAARTRPRLPAAGRSPCSTTCRVWCTSASSRVSPTVRRSSP